MLCGMFQAVAAALYGYQFSSRNSVTAVPNTSTVGTKRLLRRARKTTAATRAAISSATARCRYFCSGVADQASTACTPMSSAEPSTRRPRKVVRSPCDSTMATSTHTGRYG
jgi:hypothetical protein